MVHRYLEAVEILYAVNELNFRGASGVLLLRSQLPESNWNRIRHLSISTVFTVPMRMALPQQYLPPENYTNWKAACEAVGNLKSLHSFTVDMIIKNWYDDKPPMENATKGIEKKAFIAILVPINCINAIEVVVEMNVEIPESVRSMLEPLHYRIEWQHRPYNVRLFPQT